MTQRFAILSFFVLCFLHSNVAFAMNPPTYMSTFGECMSTELEVEEELACYEDTWHVAIDDCVSTEQPEDCWMNDEEPFSVDDQTGELILPGVFEVNRPPDNGGGIQAMTYGDFLWAVFMCHVNGALWGPVWGPFVQRSCVRDWYQVALDDCERFGGEHCWMD